MKTIKTEQVQPQAQLLCTYTTFHIGLYATLTSVLIAAVRYESVGCILRGCLLFTVACFVLAGIAGGIIGSSISLNYEEAMTEQIGLLGLRAGYQTWAHLEHRSFWAGIVVAGLGLLLAN